jgi:hypothetical protein
MQDPIQSGKPNYAEPETALQGGSVLDHRALSRIPHVTQDTKRHPGLDPGSTKEPAQPETLLNQTNQEIHLKVLREIETNLEAP